MLKAVSYIQKDCEVMICRCYGTGSFVELPERIDGLPVTRLADHCFAAEPSFRLRNEKKTFAFVQADGTWKNAGREPGNGGTEGQLPPALCAGGIEEIFLPDTVSAIGAYAFYGCRQMRKIHFPAGLKELGGGCFVDCNRIEELIFAADAQQLAPACMRDVITDITYEVTAVLEERNGKVLWKLVFPGYYEESVENTPARIISIQFEGAGFMFRQCFSQGRPSLAQYDSLFEKACRLELPETVLKMAVSRIMFPAMLPEKDRDQYLTWLKEHRQQIENRILQQHDTDLLTILLDDGFFSRETLDCFLEKAAQAGDAGVVSLLMEYRHTHFRKARDKYSF